MAILSTGSVTRLRAFVRRGMTATCAVQARTTTTGAGGVVSVVYADKAGLSAVPCSFRPAAPPQEAVTADAARATARLRVAFPPGTPVGATDRLVITHTNPAFPSPLTVNVIGPDRKPLDSTISQRVLGEVVG